MYLRMLFSDILEKNTEFFKLLIRALQFNNELWSSIPSVFFIVFSTCVLHRITHRNIGFNRNIYRDALYQAIAFQWFYLYITRGWFYVVKAFRASTLYLENLVMMSGGSPFGVTFIHVAMFTLFCAVSLIPLFLTILNFSSDGNQPNFLLWIPPNRWARNELGPAGRLMERPPDIIFNRAHPPLAYHAKRSISAVLSTTTSNVNVLRISKSGHFQTPVSSLEEMTGTEENI